TVTGDPAQLGLARVRRVRVRLLVELRVLVELLMLRAESPKPAVEVCDDGSILVALGFAVKLARVPGEDVERDRRGAILKCLLVACDERCELADRREPVSLELLLELLADSRSAAVAREDAGFLVCRAIGPRGCAGEVLAVKLVYPFKPDELVVYRRALLVRLLARGHVAAVSLDRVLELVEL